MAELNLKGEKGGSGSSFTQTPDNLRSDDTFEGVLGLAIGPLKGPVNGLKGVKIDGTQVENETGERNYGDIVINWADGDPTKFPQMVELKLGSGAAPVQVNQTLPNNATSGNPWVTRTLNNINADFIDLRFIVNQLFRQDEKGIYEHNLTIQVQLKPVGKTQWIDPTDLTRAEADTYKDPSRNVMSDILVTAITSNYSRNNPANYSGFRITGKTSSPSVHELRVDVPNTGPYANVAWDVRCRLVEPDATDTNNGKNIERRNVQWESLAGVYSSRMGDHEDWRGVAWMQVYGKASTQLTGVPEMTGEWDTKIVSVPPITVYQAETRSYTGMIWDGSWAKDYTNDPAWVINDAITDSLSGLSLIAQGSYLNKWDALECSKWCSVLVPDGAGGSHPRYSINLSINEPQKAEDFIRYLAGAVGGLAWDQGDGEWRLRVDKPETPVDIFTLETIEGEFSYSHTDVDTRFNDITMVFKNAEMDYREDRVRLFKNEHIARFGRKPTTVVAVGCTHRQEAMRRGKLRLESTTGETRIVNFSTNRRGRNVQQLDMILVADGDLGDMENRSTGRTIAVSPDRLTITLRDEVRLEVGVAYQLNFSSPNPNYNPDVTAQPTDATWKLPTIAQTRNITNGSGSRGNVTTLTLDAPLPADIPDNLSISLSAVNLPTLPKLYRVLNVVKDDSGERIGISAVEVNTAKWDLADNVTNEDTVFQDLRGTANPPELPPGGNMLSLLSMTTPAGTVLTSIAGRFERPKGGFIAGFRIHYRVNGSSRILLTERQSGTTFEIPDPQMGTYEVEVRSVDRMGNVSRPLVESILVSELEAGGIPAGGNYIHIAYADNLTGTQNFTVGSPNGRGYRGEYTDGVEEDSLNPAAYAWTKYTGPAAFGLALQGDQSKGYLRDNLIQRTVGPDLWGDFGAYSTEGFRGGVQCGFRCNNTTGEVIVGLNTDPLTDASWESIDYGWYLQGPLNEAFVYAGGVFIGPNSGWNTNTLFQIKYDNQKVYWLKDGVVVHSIEQDSDLQLYFDSTIKTVNTGITNITFAAAGSAGNNGDDGTDGGSLTVSPIVIRANALGVPISGALPAALRFVLNVGGQNVSELATWSAVTATDAGANHVANGLVSVNSILADRGTVAITATYLGQIYTATGEITKVRDGSDAQATQVTITSQPGTSYTIANATISLNMFANRAAAMAFSSSYSMTKLGGGEVYAKLMYRNLTDNGAWTQAGTTIIGTQATRTGTVEEPDNTDGVCEGIRYLPTPTEDKIYEYRVEWLRTNDLIVNSAVLQVSIT